jgi:hypothetical protein
MSSAGVLGVITPTEHHNSYGRPSLHKPVASGKEIATALLRHRLLEFSLIAGPEQIHDIHVTEGASASLALQ